MEGKIKELEKGKFYWIQVKDATVDMIDKTVRIADSAGIKYIVTTDFMEFKEAPNGLKLRKVKGGWVAEL